MEKIVLGVLPADSPLIAAWVTMRARRQSGVVRITRDQLHVLTASQVSDALRQKKKVLADVPDAWEILSNPGSIEIGEAGIARSPRSEEKLGCVQGLPHMPVDLNAYAYLRLGTHHYELVSLQFGEALLVTSEEGLAIALGAYPAGCVCALGRHDWEPWEAPASCPHDGTTVTCGA